jgi:epoxyqueuosine reductase
MPFQSQTIKQIAQTCGFALCGIAKSEPLGIEKQRFQKALDQNLHAQKAYLERDIDKRFAPKLMLENCKSVVVCGFNYNMGNAVSGMRCAVCGERYKVSRHAQIRDYHIFMKEKLEKLAGDLQEKYGVFNYKTTVDSSNISEKAWAVKSGIGYYGKNSIIQTELGSFVFIGILLMDKEVDEYDEPNKKTCGSCRKCITACPTKAISAPYYIDCNQCITHVASDRKATDFSSIAQCGWLNACDECQDACPNNRHAPINEEAVAMRAPFVENKNEILETLTPETFERYFKDTVLYPFKYEGLKRRIDAIKGAFCE